MTATINDTLSVNKTTYAVRIAIGALLGLVITAGLFWLMQYLIETADRGLNEDKSGHLIDFVRLKRDESIERRQLKPKKPPPPACAPSCPQFSSNAATRLRARPVDTPASPIRPRAQTNRQTPSRQK